MTAVPAVGGRRIRGHRSFDGRTDVGGRPTPQPTAVLAAGLAVIAGEHGALLPFLWRDHLGAAVANPVAALALLTTGAGLLRAPRSAGPGWSLVVVAVLWPITAAGVGHAGLVPLVSFVASAAVPAVMILGMFGYPGELPRRRPETVFLAVAVTTMAVMTLLLVLVGRPGWFGFPTGAWWPTAGVRRLLPVTARVFAASDVVSVVAAVGLLRRRLARMSRIEQRHLTPAALGVPVTWLLAAGSVWAQGMTLIPRAWVALGAVQGLGLLLVPACVAWAAWHTRQLRARIASLVHDLHTAHSAVAVRQVLRDHLGDPSVEILYRVDGPSPYVDGDGLPLAEEITADRLTIRVPTRPAVGAQIFTEPTPAAATTPPATELALVSVSATLRPHEDYVGAAVLAASFVLENIRLRAPLHARREELDRSLGQILDAEEEELRAFAVEHGDALQQRLLGLAMRAQAARVGVTDPVTDPAGDPAADPAHDAAHDAAHDQEWAALATTAIRASNEAAAIARGVYAPRLTSGGLRRALEDITDYPGLAIDVDVEEGGDLHTQRAAYLCLSEALSNAVKHAHAQRVSITVRPEGTGLRLVVADDGIGGVREGGDVLASLRSRAALAGGTVTVTSPVGAGTVVTAHLPGVESAPGR